MGTGFFILALVHDGVMYVAAHALQWLTGTCVIAVAIGFVGWLLVRGVAEASIRWFGPWFTSGIMIRKQRLALAIGTILVVLAGLFPPWNYVAAIPRSGNAIRRSAGYAPLFFPPTVPAGGVEPTTGWGSEFVGVEINSGVLFAEWITLVLATGGLWLFFKTFKSKLE
jgi:hypothetical protein